MLHLIPDTDGQAHMLAAECGCRPKLVVYRDSAGLNRSALRHRSPHPPPRVAGWAVPITDDFP